jgi:PII-like signaling protein
MNLAAMQPAKRIEIITDQMHVEELCEMLRKCGVEGYTVFPGLAGWGDRGEQRGDEISGASTNACILVACTEETAIRVSDRILPLLHEHGGLCLMTDTRVLRPGLR